jgi:hypothetical protein
MLKLILSLCKVCKVCKSLSILCALHGVQNKCANIPPKGGIYICTHTYYCITTCLCRFKTFAQHEGGGQGISLEAARKAG